MKTLVSTIILITSFSVLHGQTERYGILTQDGGSIFKMNQYGHPIELLHRFDTVNGSEPQGSIVQRGNEFFGRTKTGGLNGAGVLYYVNKDNHNFSTTQHLPADYNDGFLSPYTAGMNDYYYNMGCINNTRGRLYKTNFSLNTIEVAEEFAGYNTYYQPIMTLTDLFIPASVPGNNESIIFRYDLATQQLVDTLTLNPATEGKGNFQLIQLNDSIAYGVNYNGGIHNEGVITQLNLNSFTLDTLYSFDFPTIFYSTSIFSNSKLILFNYNSSDSKFTCYAFGNIQLDSLFSINASSPQSSRPGNIFIQGNNLVFSAENITYNYNLVSNILTPIAIIDAVQFGTTSYLNQPTVFYDPLGTVENETKDIQIAPNPTSDLISVRTTNNLQKTIQLTALDGRKLSQFETNEETITIDFTALSSGTYLITIESNGKNYSKTIIKN